MECKARDLFAERRPIAQDIRTGQKRHPGLLLETHEQRVGRVGRRGRALRGRHHVVEDATAGAVSRVWVDYRSRDEPLHQLVETGAHGAGPWPAADDEPNAGGGPPASVAPESLGHLSACFDTAAG